MDRLALLEIEASARHSHRLPAQAPQMHLDTALRFVPPGFMLKGTEVEIAAKLPVDALQQVEIEGGRHALGIVISGDQDVGRLWLVEADDETAARAKVLSTQGEEAVDIMVQEVANRRPRKETDAPASGVWKAVAKIGRHEIRYDRHDRERRIVGLQLFSRCLQVLGRDIDRHKSGGVLHRIEEDAYL